MSLPACKWSAAASFTLLVTGSTLTNFNVALSSAFKVASLNCVRAELNDGRQLSLQLITSGSHRNSLHPTPLPLPSGREACRAFVLHFAQCNAFSIQHSATLARWAQELLPSAESSSTWKCVKFCVEMVVRKGLRPGVGMCLLLCVWVCVCGKGEWFNA